MKKIQYIAALTLLLAMSSCTDWLDQKPISNVTTGSYFQQPSDFENAANRLYDRLYGFANGIFSGNENYAINFDYGSDLNPAQNEEGSGTKGVQASDVYYTKAYQVLRDCNNLIDQAATYTGTGNIDNSVGSAYFYRAWWHFFLLKRFGFPPMSLSLPVSMLIEHCYVLPFNSKPAALLYNTNQYSLTDAFKYGITMMTFSWLLILLFGQTVLKWLQITPGLF